MNSGDPQNYRWARSHKFVRQKCRNCAFSRQNSVCLGSSLSMRSFIAIEEPGSPVPALYATLVRIEMMSRMKPLFLFFCLVETILCGRLLVIPSTMFTFRPRVPGILSSPVHIQVTNCSIFVILLFFFSIFFWRFMSFYFCILFCFCFSIFFDSASCSQGPALPQAHPHR